MNQSNELSTGEDFLAPIKHYITAIASRPSVNGEPWLRVTFRLPWEFEIDMNMLNRFMKMVEYSIRDRRADFKEITCLVTSKVLSDALLDWLATRPFDQPDMFPSLACDGGVVFQRKDAIPIENPKLLE